MSLIKVQGDLIWKNRLVSIINKNEPELLTIGFYVNRNKDAVFCVLRRIQIVGKKKTATLSHIANLQSLVQDTPIFLGVVKTCFNSLVIQKIILSILKCSPSYEMRKDLDWSMEHFRKQVIYVRAEEFK